MTGAEFRESRCLAGLSMAEAARQAKTPYRTWQGWEMGEFRVPGIAVAWLELYGKIKQGG